MEQIGVNKLSKYFFLFLVIGIAANATGLFNDILDQDSALYASIAKTIVLKNDWLNLYANNGDWLDKPHLPFWLAAASLKIFGINAFAYKLPSFFCFLIGVLYTYKLASRVYTAAIARVSTLIYVSSLHIILCNFDVRAEGYLTAFIIAGIYHFYCAMEQRFWLKHIIAAAFFASLAIMSKGIFVLITICSGFVIYWIATKQWKQFIAPKWYLFLLLCLVFIIPELYCLYHQFDLHPEKLVFNTHGVSGLKFFFWDSQFGRFFNTGPIQGDGDIFFFVHTTLWAFLPWSIYLAIDIYKSVKQIKNTKVSSNIIIGTGAFVSFLLFSVSKFQLPHYVVIIFPLLSIIVAKYLLEVQSTKTIKWLKFIQHFVFSVLLIFIAIVLIFFKLDTIFSVLLITIICIYIFFFKIKETSIFGIVAKGMCFSGLLAVFLNIIFYPRLMQYEAGLQAAKWQQKNLPKKTVSMFNCNEYAFIFYGNSSLKIENNIADIFKKDSNPTILIYKKELLKLNKDSVSTKVLSEFSYFRITQLDASFFNYKTRSQSLDTLMIARLNKLH